jgi:Putative carbohydrate metabolism domain
MKRFFVVAALFSFLLVIRTQGQTPVPNGDFENWTSFGSYENPTNWDTPNQAISIALPFGTQVVTKSTDHESGSFSARLESKQLTLPSIVVPGVVTLGTLTINIFTQTFSLNGGVPIQDKPTHLKGFYKFQPKGGDSCTIGIGFTKWNNGVRDSVGLGAFSTHDTVNVWTPFYAWIDYVLTEQPDTFNILAISSADIAPTAGTVLYVDNISLDYTTGINSEDPAAGIDIYQDREEQQILVYFDFEKPEATEIQLFNMTGQVVAKAPVETRMKDREILKYKGFTTGVYVLEILHGGEKYCKKFFIND